MRDEFNDSMCAYFFLSWIRDMYVELVGQPMYEATARVYMINLVGRIILMDNLMYISK